MDHTQIYIAGILYPTIGRYLKLQRHISNSPWFIAGKKLTEHSMEELIGDTLDVFFKSASHKFSSAGREDADVLMLGDGRPFYYEMIHPILCIATPLEMAKLQKEIIEKSEGKISLQDLQIVPRDTISILKDSASSKSKSYRCIVQLSTPVPILSLNAINAITTLELKQKNPTRVPRRADLVRDKVIESIHVMPENVVDGNTSTLVVDLQTSAGTYVKEFMHSDDGRTEPSLKSLLGCDVTVVSLDVLKIHLNWPPRLDQETGEVLEVAGDSQVDAIAEIAEGQESFIDK